MNQTFMTALGICHVRHLKNITIPLSADQRKPLILTGKNGSGKTSLLQALKDFLEYLVSDDFQTEKQYNRLSIKSIARPLFPPLPLAAAMAAFFMGLRAYARPGAAPLDLLSSKQGFVQS